jgi:hypothetical protein
MQTRGHEKLSPYSVIGVGKADSGVKSFGPLREEN